MSNPNDKSWCICGTGMKMVHASVVSTSDLGCRWLECSSCGRKSTPAILERNARCYWENYKNMAQETKDSEHNK